MNKRFIERLQVIWANFNEREKLIVSVLGALLGLFVFALPLLIAAFTNASVEEENAELRALGQKLVAQRDKLVETAKENRIAERRYEQKAPPLGGFLETLTRDQGLTIREVADQPEKNLGKYRRRNVRIQLTEAGLAPLINLMSAVETSSYPLAIEQIVLDHFQTGDKYQLRLGVVTYDKEGARPASEAVEPANDEIPEEMK